MRPPTPSTTGEIDSELAAALRQLLAEQTGRSPSAVSEEELREAHQRILAEYEGDVAQQRTLAERFTEQAAAQPDAAAVLSGGDVLTFATLDRDSNRLARFLRRQGVGPETRVGVDLPPSGRRIVALLGILKAGGAFVAPSSGRPGAARPSLVLTGEPFDGEIRPGEDLGLEEIGGPESLAAVVEGGNGRRLMLERRHLLRRLDWLQEEIALSGSDVFLSLGGPGFDVESLWPLLSGACLRIADDAGTASVLAADVTVLRLTPSRLAALLADPQARLERLRAVLCGGETLRAGLAEDFAERSAARLIHFYAPPEAGSEVSFYTAAPRPGRDPLPAGSSFDRSVFLLDPYLQPVPQGLPGDIHLASEELPRGFLDDPAATALAFVPDPFSEEPGGRLLRTGDPGRLLPEGALELTAAAGRQAWIGGHRVDPGALEAALLEDPAVVEAAVVVRESPAAQLVAFLVVSGPWTPERYAGQLRSEWPEELLPAAWVPLSRLPLTSAGRVDEAALLRLPALDRELAQRWEQELSALPEIEEAAVLLAETSEAQPPIHLDDLLPDWRRAASTGSPVASQTAEAEETPIAVSAPPSVQHGPDLVLPAGAPATLAAALERAARLHPGHGVVYLEADGSETGQTYPELLAAAERLLGGLRGLGLTAGDKIVFQLDRLEDFIVAFWAAMLGGFVPVPLAVAPGYDQPNAAVLKLANAWRMLGCPLVLTGRDLLPAVRSLAGLLGLEGLRAEAVDSLRQSEPDRDRHPCRPDDLALLLLTSGSTGLPKAVMQSHRALLARSAGAAQQHGFTSADVTLNWMPLDHVGGTVMFNVGDVYVGSRQVHAPTAAVLEDPLRWLDWIERFRATITWAPNFAFGLINDRAEEIARRRRDLSSMRFIVNGGEAIVARTARTFLRILEPQGLPRTAMKPAWGMSETSSALLYSADFTLASTRDQDLFVEVGVPLPGSAVRVVDAAGQVVPEGTIGQMQVQGPMVTSGYYGKPELNQEVFTADGWFDTGDLAVLRDGRLSITGRAKDVIIVNGINYYSHEIEAVVEEVEGVEVSFTAACPVRPAGSDTEELAIFFHTPVADWSRRIELIARIRRRVIEKIGLNPIHVVPLAQEEIPKTGIGKIQRPQLRLQLETGQLAEVLKKIDLLTDSPRTLPAWFFRPVWRPRALAARPALPAGAWLVFLDAYGLGADLCDRLRRRGLSWIAVEAGQDYARIDARRFVLDPGNGEHYRRLLRDLEPGRAAIAQVVHLGSCDAGETGAPADLDGLREAQERGVYSLLFLAQALIAGQRPLQLTVVSRQAQSVAPDDRLSTAGAALPGLLKTIALENPQIRCRHVDLESGRAEADGVRLFRELTVATAEREVAYRGDQRLVPALVHADLPARERRGMPIEPGGLYLVTGGLGGIGARLAELLHEQFGARLLLVGRTPLPDRAEWPDRLASPEQPSARRIDAHLALEKAGADFLYRPVDIADFTALQQTVAEAEARWQSPLAGIFHLAGATGSASLEEHWADSERHRVEGETRESLEATLAPKVYGTWNLGRLLDDRPRALFVAFSSVNSLFGGSSFGAYSAASSFLDACTLDQRRRAGRRAFCFNWAMWDDLGMSRGNPAFAREAALAAGYHILSPERGLQSLLAGLERGEEHLVVGLDGDHRHLRPLILAEACNRQELAACFTGEAESPGVAGLAVPDRFGTPTACRLLHLDEMPRTADGAVDRERLAGLAAGTARPAGSTERVAPRTEIERQLAEIWRQVLGTSSPVGIHDNFFHLGGDSILSIQVLARAAEKGLRLTPKQIFQNPTVAQLAAVVVTARPDRAEQELIEGAVPLTPIQQWFFEQALPAPHHFNMALLFETLRPLEAGALSRAVAHLLVHHDALRMRYQPGENGWRQINARAEPDPCFRRFDLSGRPLAEQKRAIETAAAQLQASLHLIDGPLVRVAYFDLGPGEPGRLLLIVHHLVVDGVSWRILLEDLQTAYAQLRAGAEPQLPPKTASFKRWAERLEELGRTGALAAEAAYWLREAGQPAGTVPLDLPGGRNTEGSADTVRVRLGTEETRALLQEVPRAYRTQINDALLTALAQALAAWTQTGAVRIDLEGHGREELFDDVDVSRTVGWFTSMFPVRLALPPQASPGTALKSIKEQLRAVPNRGVGHGILRYLGGDAGARLRELPQAEVSFNYLGQFDPILAGSEGFAAGSEPIGNFCDPAGERRHLLDIAAHVVEGRLEIGWTYSRNLHLAGTIERLAQDFLAALRGLVDHCLSAEAGGATPSDFPLARLEPAQVDRLAGTGRDVEDIYPLSPTQQGLLFHSLYSPGSGMYLDQMSYTLQGQLDGAAFEQAWQRVIDRHAVLRTGIAWEALERPVQVVRRRVALPLVREDWRQEGRDESRIEALLQRERDQGFDLSRPPLMRLTLIRLADERYFFVWTSHHILIDGWARALVLKEVFACYDAIRAGREPDLDQPRSYRDYIAWLEGRSLADAEGYWREKLAGFHNPTRISAYHREDAARPGEDYASATLRLAGATAAALHRQAQRHHLTLNTLVQAAWGRLLSFYSGEGDVVFGSTFAGRPADLPGVESMVGLFINTLPVRMAVPDGAPLLGWLEGIQDQQIERHPYEHAPLAQVQGWSEVAPGTPLFESLYVFENFPVDASLQQGIGGLDIQTAAAFERTNYPLTLVAIPGTELTLQVYHETARLDRAAAERLLAHLAAFLAGVSEGLDRRVGEVPLLSRAERYQLVTEWNASAIDHDRATPIHQRVQAQAAQRGDRLAIVPSTGDGPRRRTYRELDEQSNRLAHRLLALGVAPEEPVALLLERSPDLIVAQLGVWKAGAAYVPFDPAWPAERLAFLLADCGAGVVLTEESLAGRLPDGAFRVLCLDAERAALGCASAEPPRVPVTAEQIAYVIYTSGSTGRPKGVAVSHAALANLVGWHRRAHGVSADDRATHLAGLAFDASVWEVWPYLTAGACLCQLDEEDLVPPGRLIETLARLAVTVAFLPTPLAEAVLQEPWPADMALRRLLTGGDQLHFAPPAGSPWRLFNQYGPTENTVVSTWAEIPAGLAGAPPIGRPIDNVRAYVLHRDLRLTPAGVAGELAVGGGSLARGYLGRPDLTAERFIPDAWSGGSGERLYRTGDRVRHRPGGDLEFLGRIDHQVKLRGYRIELGEIEAALGEHPSVQAAAVLARSDDGGRRLVAYVVPRPDHPAGLEELRGFLQSRLPEYMVPAEFMELAALPLTPNGKVDRRALPAPDRTRHAAFAAPRTEIERQLAEIWRQVLGTSSPVGLQDNFFHLGGDSILSIQILARAAEKGLRLTPRQIFEHPTIGELAATVEITETAGAQASQAPVEGPVPLTPVQRWFFEQDLPDPQHFNMALLFETRQPLDPETLERAVSHLVLHHDALRLRFEREGDGWRQRNAGPEERRGSTVVDLSNRPEAERAREIEAAAGRLQASLSLGEGPLLRVASFTLGPGQPGRLLLVIHHLAVDGVSWRILLQDLQTLYSQIEAGAAPQLPPKTTSFQHWAGRLEELGRSGALAAESPYWLAAARRAFAPLPADFPAGWSTAGSSASVSLPLTAEETRALLQEVPRAYRTQINDALLTALVQTLSRWTGGSTALVDLEGHGREEVFGDVDLSRTVGWFTTIFPVALELADGAPGAALKSIKEQLRAVPQRGLGYGLLRYGGGEIAAALQSLPPAEVSFNYVGQLDSMLSDSGAFAMAREPIGDFRHPAGERRHKLEVFAHVVDGRLEVGWIYSRNVYRDATIEELARTYMAALRNLIDHCLSTEAGGATPSDFPLAGLDASQVDRLVAAGRGFVEDVYPLSPMQEGMLFHALYSPESQLYFDQMSCRLTGSLDRKAFERAWQTVIDRHTILRTRFVWQGLEHPLQVVHREVTVPIRWEGWQGTATGERLAALHQADREQGFDLGVAPLMRLTLVQSRQDRAHLLWSSHHLLLDGWARNLVLKEVFACYAAFCAGRQPDLGRPAPYRDYIAWLQRQSVEEAETYWRRTLAGFTAATQVIDSHRQQTSPVAEDYAGAASRLSRERTARLQAQAQDHRLTLNTLVQAAWGRLLACYSGQDDVVFGVTSAGRPADLPGVESMVGLFINTLPVRMEIEGHETLSAWLRRLQEQQIERRQHEHAPLPQIQRWSDVAPGQPLFESLFVFENFPVDASLGERVGALGIEAVESFDRTNYPLSLAAFPGAELTLQIHHDTARLDPQTVSRLLGHLQRFLEGMADGLDRPVAEVPLLSEAERRHIGSVGRQVWLAGRGLDLGALEAALLEDPAVEEAAVLVRETPAAGRHLAACLVAAGPWVPEQYAERLRARWPEAPLPDAWIPLSRLPLTPAGRLDEAMLLGLPAVDGELAVRWEERLRALPGVQEAAVLAGERSEALPPIPLGDLLPGRRTAGARPAPGEPAAATAPVAEKVQPSGAPSVHRGAPLLLPADAPATLAGALERAARRHPDHGVSYLDREGRATFQTYPELLDSAERLLAGLRRLGLRPGDKVIFQLEQLDDFVAAFWAAMLGGFVPVPLTIAPAYDQPNAAVLKLANAWRMLDRPLVLTGRGLLPALRALAGLLDLDGLRVEAVDGLRQAEPDHNWHPGQPDDLALLLLTSGSTGLPKAVMQSHRALLTRSAATAQHNSFTPADVSFNWMPLDHVGGIVMFNLRDVYIGCRQIHAPTAAVLEDPLRWLDWMERFRATLTWAPNFAFGLINDRAEEIARRRRDLSSLRFILNAGEAIVSKTARTFLRLLAPHGLPGDAMKPAWGMSETCSAVTFSHDFDLGSTADSDPFVEVGVPIPEAAVRVVDPENRPVPEGHIGRLQVQGPTVLSGYYRRPDLNQEVFTADGWFDTGDLAMLRDGRLSITGRAKDVIIVNGINYYSHEIEAVVEEVEGVEVSYTAACPVRTGGRDTDELAIFFHTPSEDWAARIALIGRIRQWVVEKVGLNPSHVLPMSREDIPKTAIGKIQRAQLRQQLESGQLAGLVQEIERRSGSLETVPSWFYRPVWRPKEPAARPAAPPAGSWLVFHDSEGLGEDLCRELDRRGETWIAVRAGQEFARLDGRSFAIDPGARDHYLRLLREPALAGIGHAVHLWTCGETVQVEGVEALRRAQDQGIYSALFLVQALAGTALADRPGSPPVRLTVVSRQAQIAAPGDRLSPAGAALPGLLKTIPLELPALRCSHLDFESEWTEADGRRLLRELGLASPDPEVAYRNGRRLVPALAPVDLAARERREMPVETGGLYLLTGGLGGIGVRLARLLHESFDARLLLVGRAPLAERSDARLALEGAGVDFLYRAADIAELDGLEQAVAEAEARWQRPLAGIFHLASSGRLEEHWADSERHRVAAETREDFEAMLGPKVYGTWNLGRILRDRPRALFVAFSSVNSLFGGSTFGAYSAANSFLDAFALDQRSQGRPAFCFNWAMWDDLGMSRGNPAFAREAAQAAGYHILSPERALGSLLAALERGEERLAVGLDGDNRRLRPHILAGACGLRELTAFFTGEADAGDLAAIAVEDRCGIPSACRPQHLEEMPRTAAGAIDRERLAGLGAGAAQAGGSAERVAPRTAIESQLAEIWQRVLGTASPVGIHDNFFHLGGDSILSIQILARAAEQGLRLTPKQIFQNPTIAQLSADLEAARLDGLHSAEQAAIDFTAEELDGFQARLAQAGLDPGSVESAYPLSPMQQGMLLLSLQGKAAGMYFEQFYATLRGTLDPQAFGNAWQEAVRRRPELRTAFVWRGLTEPLQIVHRHCALPLDRLSWLDAAGPEQESRFAGLLLADRQRGCELSQPPLMRLTLVQLAPDTWRLLWSVHHLLVDGWSLPLVLTEVFEVYETLRRGAEPAAAEPRPTYRSYIAWLRRQDLSRAEAFWRRQLGGFAAPTPLGLDRRPAAQPAPPDLERRGEKRLQLDHETSAALRDLARRHRLTLNTLFQGAWALLLAGYSGTEDVVFGTTVSGRPPELPGVESMLGMLINTLPIRARIEPDQALLPWLAELQATQAEAREYEHTPLVEVHGWSAVPRDQPLFESLLVFENTPLDESLGDTLTGLEISDVGFSERSNYPLTWVVAPAKEIFLIAFYDRLRIGDAVIEKVLGQWQALLAEIAEITLRPEMKCGEIRAFEEADSRLKKGLARSQSQDQAEEFNF